MLPAMARRIEIELAALRDDGQWTWHAPGARLPRGVVPVSLLPEGVRAGDVLRVEAEFTVDGIDVVSVMPPKPEEEDESPRRGVVLEVLGGGTRAAQVTFDGSSRLPSLPARPKARRRAEGNEGRQRRAEETTHENERSTSARAAGGTHGARAGNGRAVALGAREGRPPRGSVRKERGERHEKADRRRPARLQPTTTYRNAALAELRPEQLPVAEQLLRGGIPAVRQAIAEQNERAEREGRPGVSPEPLLAMAEELLPRMNLASWKDRAAAARDAQDSIGIRDLRFVVAGASAVILDDEGREMLAQLRSRLEERSAELRRRWEERMTAALEAGDVRRALEASARPPEPSARIPGTLAVSLAERASEAMSADTDPDEWAATLEAVLLSPVRRSVKPRGIPRDAPPELLSRIRQAAGQVPELARLLGIPIPPPPGQRRPDRGSMPASAPALARPPVSATPTPPGPERLS